jgi:hypothetical protein
VPGSAAIVGLCNWPNDPEVGLVGDGKQYDAARRGDAAETGSLVGAAIPISAALAGGFEHRNLIRESEFTKCSRGGIVNNCSHAPKFRRSSVAESVHRGYSNLRR